MISESRRAIQRRTGAAKFMPAPALLHLAFLTSFVWLGIDRLPPGPVTNALSTYGSLSGCFRDYSFFAPNVASGIKATFIVEDPSRGHKLVTFDSGSREMVFRYSGIIASGMLDVRARDLFAQSWAALVLGGEPSAQSVTVIVERMSLPSMTEYRHGERPEWQTIYAGEFARR